MGVSGLLCSLQTVSGDLWTLICLHEVVCGWVENGAPRGLFLLEANRRITVDAGLVLHNQARSYGRPHHVLHVTFIIVTHPPSPPCNPSSSHPLRRDATASQQRSSGDLRLYVRCSTRDFLSTLLALSLVLRHQLVAPCCASRRARQGFLSPCKRVLVFLWRL